MEKKLQVHGANGVQEELFSWILWKIYYDGFWAGAAVHNSDPMVHSGYDGGIGGLIGGYPSALVDRQPEIDPSAMESIFLQQVVIPPNGFITPGAIYNAGTGQLDISMTTQFQNTLTGNWKVAVVVTEDGVTGSGSGWSQSNAYAGGSNGPMGGYESLPNPVPASLMVYDHVARDIQPSFGGMANAFPTMVSGESYAHNFTVTVDPTWNADSLHIICMLIDPTGDIDNAGYATLDEAITNGFDQEGPIGISNPVNNVHVSMFPNPANDITFVRLSGLEDQEVTVEIYDVQGKRVFGENYGHLSGVNQMEIETEAFGAGIYTVKIQAGNSVKTEKLVIK